MRGWHDKPKVVTFCQHISNQCAMTWLIRSQSWAPHTYKMIVLESRLSVTSPNQLRLSSLCASLSLRNFTHQIVMNTETMPPPLLPLLLLLLILMLRNFPTKTKSLSQARCRLGWRIRMEAVGGGADCALRKIHTLFSERSPSMTTGVVVKNDVLLLWLVHREEMEWCHKIIASVIDRRAL